MDARESIGRACRQVWTSDGVDRDPRVGVGRRALCPSVGWRDHQLLFDRRCALRPRRQCVDADCASAGAREVCRPRRHVVGRSPVPSRWVQSGAARSTPTIRAPISGRPPNLPRSCRRVLTARWARRWYGPGHSGSPTAVPPRNGPTPPNPCTGQLPPMAGCDAPGPMQIPVAEAAIALPAL